MTTDLLRLSKSLVCVFAHSGSVIFLLCVSAKASGQGPRCHCCYRPLSFTILFFNINLDLSQSLVSTTRPCCSWFLLAISGLAPQRSAGRPLSHTLPLVFSSPSSQHSGGSFLPELIAEPVSPSSSLCSSLGLLSTGTTGDMYLGLKDNGVMTVVKESTRKQPWTLA